MVKIKHKITTTARNLSIGKAFKLVFSITPSLTIWTILCIVLESATWFGTMYSFKKLIDSIILIHDSDKESIVISKIITVFAFSIIYAFIRIVSSLLLDYQANKVGAYIDDKIHEKATAMDLSFYESPAYFDILNRAKSAGPEKPAAIIIDSIGLVKNIIMLLAISYLLFSIHWSLLPLLILFTIPTLWVRIGLAKKLHHWNLSKTHMERKSSYLSHLISSDVTAKEIKLFGLGNSIRSAYTAIRVQLLKEQLGIKRKSAKIEIFSSLFSLIGVFSCIAAITFGILSGKTTVGDITIFVVAFMQSFGVLQTIMANTTTIYQNSIIVKCIFDLLEMEPVMKDGTQEMSITELTGQTICFKDVCFNYPDTDHTLQDINLTISTGKVIALVGFNGSGKSTLIKLLARLYDPDSGAVLLNGINICNYKIHEYRKRVSMVFQDYVRYNIPVQDNISFGDIDQPLNQERLFNAANDSGADLFINKLPNGYETLMGKIFEEGHEVSIGQWQKLAIARAFYSSADFIVLDEATSALDAFAEETLFANIKKNKSGKGILLISHRLSAIMQADYIYVMSEGRIQQAGTHEQLIKEEGDYRILFNTGT